MFWSTVLCVLVKVEGVPSGCELSPQHQSRNMNAVVSGKSMLGHNTNNMFMFPLTKSVHTNTPFTVLYRNLIPHSRQRPTVTKPKQTLATTTLLYKVAQHRLDAHPLPITQLSLLRMILVSALLFSRMLGWHILLGGRDPHKPRTV
jgi:hypothetical protein